MTSLAYTFTIGPGELSKQGIYLLRSILKNTEAEKDEIYVYIVEDEKEDIDDEILDEVKEKTTLIEGSMPNPDYPLSAAHGALKKTSEVTDKEYILLLDTDTVILDDIRIQEEKEGDLFLTPVPVSHKFWNSKEKSGKEFRKLFDKYGFEYPEEKTVYSNYDRKEVNPYYNGGFILTRNNDFPERWLDLSDEVFGNLSRDNYFSEMIALALLASDYDVISLGPEYNFFQTLRPYPQEGTKMAHYVDTRSLYRGIFLSQKIGSGWFYEKLGGTGVLEEYNSQGGLKKSIDILREVKHSYTRRVNGKKLLYLRLIGPVLTALEKTGTKQRTRDVANWILGKEKFKEKSY
jgi:hypothetical protein